MRFLLFIPYPPQKAKTIATSKNSPSLSFAHSCCFPLCLCVSVCVTLSLSHRHTQTHIHTLLHSSSYTLWSGNQAASNCNNWKNVPSGLFEHLLALNFSHGYRLYVLCHTIWCRRVCACVRVYVWGCTYGDCESPNMHSCRREWGVSHNRKSWLHSRFHFDTSDPARRRLPVTDTSRGESPRIIWDFDKNE